MPQYLRNCTGNFRARDTWRILRRNLLADRFICYIMYTVCSMDNVGWTNVRLKKKLVERISKLIENNENDAYCSSGASFVEVAVIQLLEDIEKKGNKIRWGKNE